MSFTSKNLQLKKGGLGFIKGATLFFLGMSCVLFVTKAFDIQPSARNLYNFLNTMYLSTDGTDGGTQNVVLNGTNGDAYFAGNVGIGISAVNPLDVNGTSRFADTITSTNGNVNIQLGKLVFGQSQRSNIYNSGANLILDPYTNVGIGTDSPTNTFHVIGEVNFGNTNIINTSSVPVSSYSSILGGQGNTIQAGLNSNIVGGSSNTIEYNATTPGHEASHESTIVGGSNNILQGDYSTIIGGVNNIINRHNKSVIIGGENNLIDAPLCLGCNYGFEGFETIINGMNNKIVRSKNSLIAGGNDSTISGHNGVFLRADSLSAGFTAQQDDTFLIKATNGVGIGTDNPRGKLDIVFNNGEGLRMLTDGYGVPTIHSYTSAGLNIISERDMELSAGALVYLKNGMMGGHSAVGVGTNTPDAMLTVNGGIRPITWTTNTNPCTIQPAGYPRGTEYYNSYYDKYCYCSSGAIARPIGETGACYYGGIIPETTDVATQDTSSL